MKLDIKPTNQIRAIQLLEQLGVRSTTRLALLLMMDQAGQCSPSDCSETFPNTARTLSGHFQDFTRMGIFEIVGTRKAIRDGIDHGGQPSKIYRLTEHGQKLVNALKNKSSDE